MRINKKVEIGIKAISILKGRDGYVSSREMAEQIGTTVNFLEQVMRNLRMSDIVLVKRGPGGGYGLNKTKEVTAWQIAKAVGKFEDKINEEDTSPVNQLMMNIEEAFLSTKI